MHHVVQLAYQVDGFQILAPAEPVRHPTPLVAAVVEVERRRDRVNTQPVDVALAEPEERVRDEEVSNLVAAVVEDERTPVGVLAEPRVCVLVERRAVESPQS